MWSEYPKEEELRREEEIITSDKCFKPAIDKGARVTRYMRHKGQEVHDVIQICLKNIPVVTQYGEEIRRGVSVVRTSAGRVLNEEMWELMERHKAEIAELMWLHEEAIQKKDDETRQEIEAERAKLQEVIAGLCQNITIT